MLYDVTLCSVFAEYRLSFNFIFFFWLEEKVTLPYLLFKIVISFYLLVAYIISHVTSAISSESCAIKQNGTSSKNFPDHTHIVDDESNPSASTCTLSDWPYYWIYFTNWSWTLLCLSFLLDTTLVGLRYRKERMHLHHIVGESKTASADKGSHFKLPKIKCFLIFYCDKFKWNVMFI